MADKHFKALSHSIRINEDKDLAKYLPLYGAALVGDWEEAKRFFDADRKAVSAKITKHDETVLHIAVRGGNAAKFVGELVKIMDAKTLEETDDNGRTALYLAAIAGNTKVAKMLVQKNPKLPQIRFGSTDRLPLHRAAQYGHKDMFFYLYSVTKYENPQSNNLFTGESGVDLVTDLINACLNGIALSILKQYPVLAENQELQKTVLNTLSRKPFDFESGSRMGYLESLTYKCIQVMDENLPVTECSKEGSRLLQQISTIFGTMHQKVHFMLWNPIKRITRSINQIRDRKLKHVQTLQLAKLIMRATVSSSYENASEILRQPLYEATRLGIHELVKEIIMTYPPVALSPIEQHSSHNIVEVAVENRQDEVFNLICQMGLHKYFIGDSDVDENNILHLTGQLKPSSKVSGEALQMQQELQWFKCVEDLVLQSAKEEKNVHGKTPKELFTESHTKLVKAGEEWTKNIALSCIIAATLIATVVFAAAFTVPGGTNDQGIPNFLNETSFLIFSIADALAFFFSSTSVLMFLGMLISRYSEEDFLKSVPNKLIIGLLSLLISIALMMMAFGATLHIVVYSRWSEAFIPIAVLACLPVMLFAWLQFPLLFALLGSTYGRGIVRITK